MFETFASRVAAGLLSRADLLELVTDELMDYEEKAIELAHNPQQLAQIKNKIKPNLTDYCLFNPPYFMQQLASEYKKIWQNFVNSA